MKTRCETCRGTKKMFKNFIVYDPYHKKDIVVKHEVSCEACGGTGEVGHDDPPKENMGHRKLED